MCAIATCQNEHVIRRGMPGDESTGMEAHNRPPLYVLLCNGQQVGGVDGIIVNHIAFFRIFNAFQGVRHSEIFLELLENEARNMGIRRIETVTPTSNPRMMRAFERQGFRVLERDELGDPTYFKEI